MVSLAPTVPADLPAILRLEHQPENSQYILPYALDRHQQAIDRMDEMHLKVLTEEGSLAGFVLLAGLDNEHRSIEFRRLVISQKGVGYGRSVIRLVKQYCFEELLCHRLWLDVFEDNARARHLYHTEGFREEGLMRECIRKEGVYRNLLLMSMLDGEYVDFLP